MNVRTIAIALLLFTVPAAAGDITLRWNAPTSTQICQPGPPPQNLAGYRIYELVAEINDPDAVEYVVEGKLPGDHSYVATAFTTINQESALSAATTKTVEAFETVGGPVWDVIKRPDQFLLLVVGNVPAGTACDPEQSVAGKYVVPFDAVNWTGTVRPPVVVADCQ